MAHDDDILNVEQLIEDPLPDHLRSDSPPRSPSPPPKAAASLKRAAKKNGQQ